MIRYTLEQSALKSGISADDFTGFYLLRQYIKKEPYGYSATMLGIEKGCFVNDKNRNAFATEKAVCRAVKVFAACNFRERLHKTLTTEHY